MMRQEWRTFNGGAWEKEIQEIIDQFIMKLRLLLTCPKSCRIYIARAGILIQISIVTTDTISKSEIVNAQAMYSNTIGNEI